MFTTTITKYINDDTNVIAICMNKQTCYNMLQYGILVEGKLHG